MLFSFGSVNCKYLCPDRSHDLRRIPLCREEPRFHLFHPCLFTRHVPASPAENRCFRPVSTDPPLYRPKSYFLSIRERHLKSSSILILSVVITCLGPLEPAGAAVYSNMYYHPQITFGPDSPNAGYVGPVAVGDFDSDGRDDLAFLCESNVLVYHQSSAGLDMSSPDAHIVHTSYIVGGALAVGDLNHDARDDIAVSSQSSGLCVLLQKPGGGFSTNAYAIPEHSAPRLCDVADVNSDGYDDLMLFSAYKLSVLPQSDAGLIETNVFHHYSPDEGAGRIAFADFTGDGRIDGAVCGVQRYACSLHPQKPPGWPISYTVTHGSFLAPVSTFMPKTANRVTTCDLDEDGKSEVVRTRGGNVPSGYVEVHGLDPSGIFTSRQSIASYEAPHHVIVSDADLDGHNDILVSHVGWGHFGIYVAQPDGRLTNELLYRFSDDYAYGPEYFQGMAAGDFNSDGAEDIAFSVSAEPWPLAIAFHRGSAGSAATLEFRAAPLLATITTVDGTGIWSVACTPRDGFDESVTVWVEGAYPDLVTTAPVTFNGAVATNVDMWVESSSATVPGRFAYSIVATSETFAATCHVEVVVSEDRDGDMLPDRWELEYFPSILVTDGSGDPDTDGALCAAEFEAKTDPSNDAEYPNILVTTGLPDPLAATIAGVSTQYIAHGSAVTSHVPHAVYTGIGRRFACSGWDGLGGVPATGDTNELTFVLTDDSRLDWRWREESLLASIGRTEGELAVRGCGWQDSPSSAAFVDFGGTMKCLGDRALIGAKGMNPPLGGFGTAFVARHVSDTNWIIEAELDGYGTDQRTWHYLALGLSEEHALIGGSVACQVFERSGSNWTWQARLMAHDGESSWHSHGGLCGDTAACTAPRDTDHGNYGIVKGSVVVYRRDGTNWFEEAKLAPRVSERFADSLRDSDDFGDAVVVSDDRIIVGAPYDNEVGEQSGMAYVFHNDGTNWYEEARLVPSMREGGASYGDSVALHGDVAAVGAPGATSAGLSEAGAVYVFRLIDGVWREEQRVESPDAATGDNFGTSVALSGFGLVVGCPDAVQADYPSSRGLAYLYRNTPTGFRWSRRIGPSRSASYAGFGHAVDIDGTNLAVSLPDHQVVLFGSGSVEFFGLDCPTSLWSEAEWFPGNVDGVTVTAPNAINPGTPHRFIEWRLDGAVSRDESGMSHNPSPAPIMTDPLFCEAIYAPEAVDDDGDGIKDWWERRYFGGTAAPLDTDSDSDGVVNSNEYHLGGVPWDPDTDGDGMRDGDEVLAGTRIPDAESVLAITNIQIGAQTGRVSWSCGPGITVLLERADAILPGGIEWLPVATNVSDTETDSIQIPTTDDSYFRLRLNNDD